MPEVRLLGSGLRRLAGGASLRLPGRSVAEVLSALVERGGPGLERAICAEGAGAPHPDLKVLVNGRSVEFLEGLETSVSEDDDVTLYLFGARGYPGG